MRWARASNSLFSFARRATWAFFSFSIMALFESFTAMAMPRGRR